MMRLCIAARRRVIRKTEAGLPPRNNIRMTKTTILAAAILLCLHAGITQAQDAPDGSDDADTLDAISVVGTGQTRQVQALGKADLSR